MYLYIDTSERDFFTVAVFDESRFLKKKKVKSERKHSEKLLGSIKKILLDSGADLKSLKGIAAVLGPGSFTSLRIGISTANALAFGLGIPSAGVPKPAYELDKDFIIGEIEKNRTKKLNIIIPEYGREPDIK